MHNNLLNMTYVALRFSRWVNGVAMQHGKVSQQMFPDYHVESITNGVHAATWISRSRCRRCLDAGDSALAA